MSQVFRCYNPKNYKTFDQVKVGDFIFYYDKGKIHKQLVKKIESREEIRDYGWGNKRIFHISTIYAGRGTKMEIYSIEDGRWELHWKRLLRWSDARAAIDYMKGRIETCEWKIKWAQRDIEYYTKLKEKYATTID